MTQAIFDNKDGHSMGRHTLKVLSSVMAVIVFAGFVWSAQTYLHENYASASDVKRIEDRLDSKILEDRLFNVQERIWRIEDRYERKEMSIDAKEQRRLLIDEKTKIEKELDSLKKSE